VKKLPARNFTRSETPRSVMNSSAGAYDFAALEQLLTTKEEALARINEC
jgi:hypothetical protein